MPPPAPPTTTLAPATLTDLSASATSTQDGRQLNCRSLVKVKVTLTNRAQSGVSVTGVRKASRVLKGRCDPADTFTYSVETTVGPGASDATVMNRALFLSGSGCCVANSRCDGSITCQVEDSFDVVTEVGSVEAGSIRYKVNFMNCETCQNLSAAGRGAGSGYRLQ